jgi:hypothetical protein
MPAIDPPVRLYDAPDSAPRPGSSRTQFYLLRLAEIVALIVFLSFCVMWLQWQLRSGVSQTSGDFVSFWTAGQLALEGAPADAYHQIPHFLKQLELHGNPTWGYLAFFYPPFFLLLCASLAMLGYMPALVVWLLGTLAGYVAAVRALLPKSVAGGEPVWLILLGYPAVMVNAGFGQNGYLSTALFGGAAVWLDRRPVLAGICFGCLAYKPQLGIIVPLGLAVARRWRCFAAAAVTVVVLSLAATAAFGWGIWPEFLRGMSEARRDWMERINPGYLQFWITVFGAIRLHGGSLVLAYGLQAVVTITAAALLVYALSQRHVRSGRAQVAAIAACGPFCSPFMLEYDLVILAMPMAWLMAEGLRDGFRRGEIAALIAVFAAPVLFKLKVFDLAIKPVAIVAAAALFAVVLRRVVCDPQPAAIGDSR